jgi:hypothetical protein
MAVHLDQLGDERLSTVRSKDDREEDGEQD